MTLNVLSTNIGSYLSMRQTLSAAKDCVKHFGQGGAAAMIRTFLATVTRSSGANQFMKGS